MGVKIVVALLGAMAVSGLATVVLPLGDIGPVTPGRVVLTLVFYTTWGLLIFKLVVGEFIPSSLFKGDEA